MEVIAKYGMKNTDIWFDCKFFAIIAHMKKCVVL